MEILKTLLVLVHTLGLAALIGGAFVQWNAANKQASPSMLWGARVQLISGLVLWGLVEATEQNVHHFKFATKLVFNIVVVGILESSRRSLSNNGFMASLGLSVLNVALALFWTTSSDD
jgi:uncharacterized membrane protein HdeD (DUF308 family)